MTNRDDITSGPIARTVFKLAVPPVLGMLMVSVLSLTDFYWVGKLGATAQDAITSSMVVQWTIYSLVNVIAIGITALVARYVGAREFDRVQHYIRQAYWLTALMAVLISVAGYLIAPWLLSFMGSGPDTLILAIPYLRVIFIASVLITLEETSFAIFRASGDTKTPMVVGTVAVVLNMILDPLLIFGIGPFPEMGVVGAAVATAVALLVSVIWIHVLMLHGKLGYRVSRLFKVRPDWSAMGKISLIGLPIASQQLVFMIVYFFLIKIVHQFGEAAGAAMGIGNRMESISYLTCYGFSLAASTLVGQNLGAGKPGRAARCAWGATGLGALVTLVTSAMFILVPEFIASIFTSDPEVHAIAVDYLIILGLSQTAMAFEIVLEGAFSGAGDTIPPMVVMLPLSVARVPLAYWLAIDLDWGINGVWWTLTITTGAKALILGLWFKLGHWKNKKV